MDKSACILGAGVAGLGAAMKFTETKWKLDIFEKNKFMGGMCYSFKRDGFTFDLGGHRFITKNEGLLKRLNSIMADDWRIRDRKSQIFLNGKYFHYPLKFNDIIKKLTPLTMLNCSMDYLFTLVRNSFSKNETMDSFEKWVVRNFGDKLYQIFFKPYNIKLWGIEPSKISADWASQRISFKDMRDVIKSTLSRNSNNKRGYAESYYYPDDGIGRLPQKMGEEVFKHNNSNVYLDTHIHKVYHHNNKITGLEYSQNGSKKMTTLPCENLVSTIQLPDFCKLLSPAPPEEVVSAANSLRFRSVVFLNIMVDRNSVTDNSWLYFPEEKFVFFRIVEPKNWSEKMAPEGKTSLCLEIACDKGDDLWNATSDELLEKCLPSLIEMDYVQAHEILDHFVTKAEHAYPIYEIDYKEKTKCIIDYLDQFKNFIICGRQGMFRYNNMDHSIEAGFLAAEYLNENVDKQDVLKVANSDEPFE